MLRVDWLEILLAEARFVAVSRATPATYLCHDGPQTSALQADACRLERWRSQRSYEQAEAAAFLRYPAGELRCGYLACLAICS